MNETHDHHGAGCPCAGRSVSRRDFCGVLLRATLLTALTAQAGRLSAALDVSLRGGKVKWARLKTPSPTWHRHSRGDLVLLEYLRQKTTLNIDGQSYWADCAKLDQMCGYPLLFSEGTQWIVKEADRTNIGEYLRRGGFMIIDSCIGVNHDADGYFAAEKRLIQAVLPEARIALIPNDHEIFHCFFDLPGGVPHTFFKNVYDPSWARYGLHAIYHRDRLAGVLSLSGIQCGWDRMGPAGHEVVCMQMLVNLYTYALTH